MSGKGYIGVDWGSSSFRAFRYDGDGRCHDRYAGAHGIKTVENGAFADCLRAAIGGWLGSGAPVVLSGMITSRNGWVETPYVDCPAHLSDLAAAAVRQPLDDDQLIFLPGVAQLEPEPDVMRGEELQLVGLGRERSGWVVLPGTHSKWAELRNGSILRFRTFMTGELFEFFTRHSLVGRISGEQAFDEDRFAEAVRIGHDEGCPTATAFSARARVLRDRMPAAQVHCFLSGLLIGNEIREAQALLGTVNAVSLLGAEALCARYVSALDALGIAHEIAPDTVTENGFRIVAAQVGLTAS